MGGLTLDAGALIGLERQRKRIREVVAVAQAGKDRITVPADVIAEWSRGPGALFSTVSRLQSPAPSETGAASVASAIPASAGRDASSQGPT
jgi:hypothetical protein